VSGQVATPCALRLPPPFRNPFSNHSNGRGMAVPHGRVGVLHTNARSVNRYWIRCLAFHTYVDPRPVAAETNPSILSRPRDAVSATCARLAVQMGSLGIAHASTIAARALPCGRRRADGVVASCALLPCVDA
jgi:hypothetical protein